MTRTWVVQRCTSWSNLVEVLQELQNTGWTIFQIVSSGSIAVVGYKDQA